MEQRMYNTTYNPVIVYNKPNDGWMHILLHNLDTEKKMSFEEDCKLKGDITFNGNKYAVNITPVLLVEESQLVTIVSGSDGLLYLCVIPTLIDPINNEMLVWWNHATIKVI